MSADTPKYSEREMIAARRESFAHGADWASVIGIKDLIYDQRHAEAKRRYPLVLQVPRYETFSSGFRARFDPKTGWLWWKHIEEPAHIGEVWGYLWQFAHGRMDAADPEDVRKLVSLLAHPTTTENE